MHILLAEAEDDHARVLEHQLNRHAHEVTRVGSGRAALLGGQEVDMILLALELPDLDGLEVCRTLRADTLTPLIAFTPPEAHVERVLSLHAGADDCLTRPFEFRELLARMEAVRRRATVWPMQAAVISHGPLSINRSARRATLHDEPLTLTRKEFDVLHLLASSPTTVIPRKELMAKVWADEWARSSRTVDTHISTLRNKLGAGDWIVTVRGIGYRLGTVSTAVGRADGRRELGPTMHDDPRPRTTTGAKGR